MQPGLLPHPITTATWRVYSAEQSIGGGRRFRTAATIEKYIATIIHSSWWRNRFADVGPISVEVVDRIGDGTVAAHCRRLGTRHADGFVLVFGRRALFEAVVLHELAHCVQPLWTGDPRVLQCRGAYVERRQPEMHCWCFTAAHSMLTAEFGSTANHDELLDAYQHFEVPVGDHETLVAARELSERFGERHDHDSAELRQELERARATGAPLGQGLVPEIGWGDWMRVQRSRAARSDGMRGGWSKSALVKAVVSIGRYTIADIAALEQSKTMPDELRLRRLAMSLGVVYDLDPVWARTALGLFRDDCGIDFDELVLLNPAWVEHVEHLNHLAASRSSLWSLGADR